MVVSTKLRAHKVGISISDVNDELEMQLEVHDPGLHAVSSLSWTSRRSIAPRLHPGGLEDRLSPKPW